MQIIIVTFCVNYWKPFLSLLNKVMNGTTDWKDTHMKMVSINTDTTYWHRMKQIQEAFNWKYKQIQEIIYKAMLKVNNAEILIKTSSSLVTSETRQTLLYNYYSLVIDETRVYLDRAYLSRTCAVHDLSRKSIKILWSSSSSK